MTFPAWSEPIVKENLPIPKQENWYLMLTATPNRVFGENVLVAAGMSDQWAPNSKDVPVLKFDDREVQLYQAAFPTFGGFMGVRPLRAGEEYWYDQIKGHFMYPVADAFADPPTSTEGAHIPNPCPLRAMTSAAKEIVYLSSEESVGSSNGELSSWSTIFAGVLRDLGIDPEEKKKKPKKKKVITLDVDVTSKKGGSSRVTTCVVDKGTLLLRQSNLEDYVIISDSFEGLSRIGVKKVGAPGSKSSGSSGSRNPDAGATPSSAAHEEGEDEEEVEEEEPAVQLIRKRSREAAIGASVMSKPGGAPLIGKRSNLRSLYRFSHEPEKKTSEKKGVTITEPSEPAPKRPKVTKVTIKPFKAPQSEKEKQKAVEKPVKGKEMERKRAADKPLTEPKEPEVTSAIPLEKAQGPEEVRITGLYQPIHERGKGTEVKKPVKHLSTNAPVQTTQVTSAGESGSVVDKERTAGAGGASAGFAAGQAGAGRQGAMTHSPIGPMDTLGDIYYKSYTEEGHGDAPHQPPWGLKQKDIFLEFAPCRDWLLNSIPLGEVNRQRERTHSALYHAYVVGEANTRAANHQIVREWRTMVREREEWEKYRERQNSKPIRKQRSGDVKALRANSALLKISWQRSVLTGRQFARKTTSACTPAAKEQAEAELKTQVSSKDKDLAAKDVEIAELKRRLQEQVDKSESLEIDLVAERSKAASAEEAKQKAEEARAITSSALNVAQNNYAKVQGIVDTLASETEWRRGRGLVLMANSILNAGELDGTVAALIDASRAVGHRGGYLECAQHAEEIFGQEFDTSHCSVADEVNAELTRAENAYDHLALLVMDLITKALEHDDWCARLKAILDPPEMVEVSDEEEPAGDDGEGGGNGDDGGNGDGDGDGDEPE
ncbi:hypothetical protein HanRHA438_Chr13g0581541 [Helianthus annuus]|nr:hypothetical protein HanHA300_Chr13g0467501 [Helianthus annuus]KAJ0662455.1 hypothetical protein HanLR1_Chr13g0469671 [Helianthus annuus]KAJ0669982.1 hypothetical protein HanOQP8_Chr13g0468771 [Helianthus annuus]KAJ0856714.1 hypothetical protein HanRHA438_Chr13g0581541 [Helianthus annuus]